MAVAHRSLLPALSMAAVNLLETTLMVLMFRRVWRFPYPNITITRQRA